MGIRTFCQLLSATCDIPSAIFADKKFSIVLEQITKPVGAQPKFTRVVGSSGHKLCVGLGQRHDLFDSCNSLLSKLAFI
jgi:hypothetical protein